MKINESDTVRIVIKKDKYEVKNVEEEERKKNCEII